MTPARLTGIHACEFDALEGDAALLYAELGNDEPAVLRDVFAQVNRFFASFHAKAGELSGSRSDCPCDACQRIRDLRLKAILHRGSIAFRKIRQFDEMAGGFHEELYGDLGPVRARVFFPFAV